MRHGNLAPFADIMAGRANEPLVKSGSLPNIPNSVGQVQHGLNSNHGPGNGHITSRRNLNFESANTGHTSNNTDQSIDAKSFTAAINNNSGVKSVAFLNSNNGGMAANSVGVKASNCTPGAEGDSDEDPDNGKKGKKRKSGILTKPDEVDIIQTIRFPHKLLDDRHIKGSDKIYAKLNFAQLCAGELELIKRAGVPQDEKDTRIELLLTLCYHSAYLSTEELKSQYSATLQRIERGSAKWDPVIAERLHNNLAFRASVISREKEKLAPVKNDKPGADKLISKGGPKAEGKLPFESKIHYCADYNKGTCVFEDNHEGRLNNKDVTLWHLCKRCLLSEGKLKRTHPESDINCPSRA